MNQNAIKALCEKLGRPTEVEGGARTTANSGDEQDNVCQECGDHLPCDCDDEAEGGPAPAVKPGTRCECRESECRANSSHGHGSRQPYQCAMDAVRLVTVRVRQDSMMASLHEYDELVEVEVPLCAACAEYHERGGK